MSGSVLAPGYVVTHGDVIIEVGEGVPAGQRADVALESGILAPGLVDLQVNGYYGVDFVECDAADWARVTARLPETGVTAFLPTFITAPVADLAAALRRAREVIPGLPAGARVLGVHLEGPFLSPRKAGAHDPQWIIPPAPDAVDELISAGEGVLRLMTLAAESDGAPAAVKALAEAGVLVSVGHSDATAAQVAAAADAGARMVTHLYDAQRGLHHREPGVVGQALTDTRLTSGLIVDLAHVVAQACAIAFAAAPGRVCLVTDAASCAGMPPGQYLLGGKPVTLPPGDGVPPTLPDGTLAGSALRLDRAIANAVAAGLSLPAAIEAATRVPADLIGHPELGRIAPGGQADLVWLSDDLRAGATWVAGERVA